MLPNVNQRKNSIQQSQGSEQCSLEYMFPHQDQQNLQQTWNWLNKHYNPKYHSAELVNFCFRNHKPNLVAMYNKFRNEFHMDLQQPNISQFFKNSSFPDLVQIGKFFGNANGSKYPSMHIPPVSKDLGPTLDEIFNEFGYIPNLEHFLLIYPTLLCKMQKFRKMLFQQDLCPTILYFVAIYAAAELGCVYMMNRMISKYRHQGGDMQWIYQANYPKKFKVIFKLARKLARCSWQIDVSLISQIIGGEQQENTGKYEWNQQQLVVLTHIISFTQYLSTIALALGLKPEYSFDILNIQKFLGYVEEFRKTQYQTCQFQQLASIIDSILPQQGDQVTSLKTSKKNLKKSFKRIENQENVEGYMRQIGRQLTQQKGYQILYSSLNPFLLEFQLVHKRREHQHPKFDYSQYSFNFNTYPYLQAIVPNLSNTLVDMVSYTQGMTNNKYIQIICSFGKLQLENSQTLQFRRAIRFYSENLVGYTHFNYNENLKKYLTMPLKFYIRLLTLSPMHITKQVIKEVGHQNDDQQVNCLDLGHLAILVANSQMLFGMMKVFQNLGQ